MSADPDKGAACPIGDKVTGFAEGDPSHGELQEQKKKNRSVRFPNENQLVTEYFEPANPWHDGKLYKTNTKSLKISSLRQMNKCLGRYLFGKDSIFSLSSA